jgi:hypothetical protein
MITLAQHGRVLLEVPDTVPRTSESTLGSCWSTWSTRTRRGHDDCGQATDAGFAARRSRRAGWPQSTVGPLAAGSGHAGAEALARGVGAAAAVVAQVTANRIGTSQDVADAVAFLASNEASYINGQDLIIDGGLVAAIR